LKSCPGVLFKADLTGHGHPTLFGRNGLNWLCPVRPALKRTHVQDFNAFSIMSRFSEILNSIRQLFCHQPFVCEIFSLQWFTMALIFLKFRTLFHITLFPLLWQTSRPLVNSLTNHFFHGFYIKDRSSLSVSIFFLFQIFLFHYCLVCILLPKLF
jgi:hypothetical protein